MSVGRRALALDGNLSPVVPPAPPQLLPSPAIVFHDGVPFVSSDMCIDFRVTESPQDFIDATVFGGAQCRIVSGPRSYDIEFTMYYRHGFIDVGQIDAQINISFRFGDTRYRGPVRVTSLDLSSEVDTMVTIGIRGRSLPGFVVESVA